ncbi:MAG: ATP-grasp domain-containing protein [Deltaproteobacteria bacterium]|nr:ATP-grasp domain-containing protein [Deltaproteobacteria bacterium]
MKRARILLTTAGRKSYLAGIFKAARQCGAVVAVDSDPLSPIRHRVDHFAAVPTLDDPEGFVEAIHALCRAWDIDCVLPQNDRELLLMASARRRFEKDGIRIAGVEPDVVARVADKFALREWMLARGFAYPETWLDYPEAADARGLVEKDRFGQGSAGLAHHAVRPAGALPAGKVVQPRLVGTEYNLDVLRDGAGDVVAVSVKQKLSMQGGSTDRAVSVDSPELVRLGARLADELGVFGSIDVDVMVCDGVAHPIDVNPRIGGGFPFTAAYCPAYVEALLEVCTGAPVGPRPLAYEAGVLVCREFTFSSSTTSKIAAASTPEPRPTPFPKPEIRGDR